MPFVKNREQEFVNYCKENSKLPPNGTSLRAWGYTNKDKYPEVKKMFEIYTNRLPNSATRNRTAEVIAFYEKTGRLPKHGMNKYETSLHMWIERNKDIYPELKKLCGESKVDGKVPADFVLPWMMAKSEYDLCAKYALTTELRRELEMEIFKKDYYRVSETETMLKKFLGGLSRDPRWYDIPENRADLIASVMQKEKED